MSSFSRAALLFFVVLACAGASAQTLPELVSRDRLRVCADPANMPFSDRKREGFENRIAEIVADELKLPLHYYWMPQGPGFVRNTLGEAMCDLIVGYAADSDVVDHSNPYYASTYVLVSRAGSGLEQVQTLEDPRLAKVKLGVIAATPPTDHLLRLGLLDKARVYALLVDRRYASPSEDAIHDVAAGVIDAAVVWGPIGGYFAKIGGFFAKDAQPQLAVSPLHADQRPALAFRIAFGIRRNELEWKHRLNDVIRARQADIDRVLRDFGAPLVPIAAAPLGPSVLFSRVPL
jgi:quinoprotein dehydrogenase-associated probable ABC transporter substrate-binding protein